MSSITRFDSAERLVCVSIEYVVTTTPASDSSRRLLELVNVTIWLAGSVLHIKNWSRHWSTDTPPVHKHSTDFLIVPEGALLVWTTLGR